MEIWDIIGIFFRDIPGVHNSYENMGKARGSDLEQNGDINGDIKWDIYNDSLWIPSGKKIWLAGNPAFIGDFPIQTSSYSGFSRYSLVN